MASRILFLDSSQSDTDKNQTLRKSKTNVFCPLVA